MTNREWEKKHKSDLDILSRYNDATEAYRVEGDNIKLTYGSMMTEMYVKYGGYINYKKKHNIKLILSPIEITVLTMVTRRPDLTHTEIATKNNVTIGALGGSIGRCGGIEKAINIFGNISVDEYNIAKRDLRRKKRIASIPDRAYNEQCIVKMFELMTVTNHSAKMACDRLGYDYKKLCNFIYSNYTSSIDKHFLNSGHIHRLDQLLSNIKLNRFMSPQLIYKKMIVNNCKLGLSKCRAWLGVNKCSVKQNQLDRLIYTLDTNKEEFISGKWRILSIGGRDVLATLSRICWQYFDYNRKVFIEDVLHGDIAECIQIERDWIKFKDNKITEEQLMEVAIEKEAMLKLTKGVMNETCQVVNGGV